MDKKIIFERLTEIFQNNFDDDQIELDEQTSFNDIEGWDSLEQINLIAAIQDEFHIHFNIEEVNSMINVERMSDLIAEKVKGI